MSGMGRWWAWVGGRAASHLVVLVLFVGCDDGHSGNPSAPSATGGAHGKNGSGSGTIGAGDGDNSVNMPPPTGAPDAGARMDAGTCKHGGEPCTTFSECC